MTTARFSDDFPRLYAMGASVVASLALGLLTAACGGGGDWPKLSSVSRPAAAGAVADTQNTDLQGPISQADLTSVAAPEPLEPASQISVQERLPQLEAAFTAKEQAADEAYRVYTGSLDRFLTVRADGDDLVSWWSAAQSALSRLSMAVDELRVAREDIASDALAITSKSLHTDSGLPANLLALGQLVERSAAGYSRYRTALAAEGNRLATLTPGAFGSPGPSSIGDAGRTPFATISFTTQQPLFSATLRNAVLELQKTVPDVAFDLQADGPTGSTAAQQAALRRVMAELRGYNVAPHAISIALKDEKSAAAGPLAVRIYLKKTSL